jgi:hypothetical protein
MKPRCRAGTGCQGVWQIGRTLGREISGALPCNFVGLVASSVLQSDTQDIGCVLALAKPKTSVFDS